MAHVVVDLGFFCADQMFWVNKGMNVLDMYFIKSNRSSSSNKTYG